LAPLAVSAGDPLQRLAFATTGQSLPFVAAAKTPRARNDKSMRQKLPNVCSAVIILLLAAVYFGVFGDLDWSWQVRTGELIVQNGSLRLPDTFSYTIHGTIVQDFEWLYEAALWATWNAFGFGGLKFLKVLAVGIPLVLVARQLRREGVRAHGIILAIFAAIFVLSSAWNLRPLYCTTIGLLLTSTMLHNHCTGRQQLSWGLPLVMLLWANLHPGVITGQGLLLGAIGWEWFNQKLRWNKPLDWPSLKRLTLIGGLALAATFLSPDPIERLRYPFKPELAHPIMRVFVEMQPLAALLPEAPLSIGLIYVFALLVLITSVVRFRHYRLWELALMAGLALLANYAFRSAMDWFLVMLALGVPHLKALLAEAAKRRRRFAASWLLRLDRKARQTLNQPWFRFQPFWLGAALAALFVISVIPPVSRAMPRQNASDWPVAALDYMEKADIQGRFFAPPDYGAYIGWRLRERGQIYTDTRGFFFPPVLLEDSHYVPQLGPDWRNRLTRVLDEYHTDYFLLETTGARGALWHTIKECVGTPLFVDEQSVLLSAKQLRCGVAAVSLQIAHAP
jgi:hypothetical protein